MCVRLYAGPLDGEPTLKVLAPWTDGGIRFGGFAPGTYDVWIDAPGFAPALLPDRVLEKGRNDLGEVVLDPGSTITLHILVTEGQAHPRIGLRATREGEPSYYRSVSSRGEASVTLTGLGPGRFKLRASGQMGLAGAGRTGLDEVIEVDGQEAIERTLDLR